MFNRWMVLLAVAAGVCSMGCSSEQTWGDCSSYTGGCAPNAECVMAGGVPTCQCKTGYVGNGESCVDQDAPVLAVSSPQADALVSTATVEVRGTASDVDLAEVTVSLDGAPEQRAEVSGGAFSLQVPVPAEDHARHTVVVTARDASKRETMLTRSFSVDRVGPVLTVVVPAKDASCASRCVGGIVNLDSGASLEFSGTASDKGEVVLDSLVATLDDQPVELTKGGEWSFRWTVPNENGAFHTFKLVGQDKAGNTAEVTRTVYVDRVAPCAKNLVPNARLVKRTDALVEFTEPMDSTSAAMALVTNPAVTALPVLDSTGKRLAFAKDEDLVAYQVYGLDLRTTATDLAGNPVGDGAGCRMDPGKWLTAPVAAPSMGGSAVAIDVDGLPHWLVSSGEEILLESWDGRGQYTSHMIGAQSLYEWISGLDFRIDSAPRPDLLLSRVGYLVTLRGNEVSQSGDAFVSLESQELQDLTTVVKEARLEYPVAGVQVPDLQLSGPGMLFQWETTGHSYGTFGVDPADAKRVLLKPQSGTWASAKEWYRSPAPIRGIGGVGLVHEKPIYLPDKTELPFAVAVGALTVPVFGMQRRSQRENGGFPTAVGAGWMAWAEPVKAQGVDYAALYLACSVAPSNPSSWKRSLDLSPIPSGERNSGIRIVDIRMASNDTVVAIAVGTSDGKVVSTTLANDCVLPVAAQWSAAEMNVRATIGVGPDGKVWKATRVK